MSAQLREVLFAPPTVLQPRPPTLLFPSRRSGYVRWCGSDPQAVQAARGSLVVGKVGYKYFLSGYVLLECNLTGLVIISM